MFSTEREQKKLRDKSTNKCRIEASICEATLNEEVANFTTKYYHDSLPTRHNPVSRYNNDSDPADAPELSILAGLGGRSSGAKQEQIDSHEQWTAILSCVLKNTVEVKPYIE